MIAEIDWQERLFIEIVCVLGIEQDVKPIGVLAIKIGVVAAAVRAWNSLSPFVRDAPLQVAFRRELKNFPVYVVISCAVTTDYWSLVFYIL